MMAHKNEDYNTAAALLLLIPFSEARHALAKQLLVSFLEEHPGIATPRFFEYLHIEKDFS
jgi:hypothetical protein